MKKLVSFLFPMALLLSCNSAAQNENIGVSEASDKMDNEEVVVLDVRTPGEYREGHIADARNINVYGDNFEEKINELPKDKEYVVYCQSGNRSGKAQSKMKEMGFDKVYNLEGGIVKWKREGKEVEK